MAGYRGFPWMISYSASKAALIAYLEALRPGLARRGITVTTVCPGFVRTAMSTAVPYSARSRCSSPSRRPGTSRGPSSAVRGTACSRGRYGIPASRWKPSASK